MSDSSDRPAAPDEATRAHMATAFIESAGYDGGDACRGILKSIRAGWLIFIQPDKLQLTREGEAHLQREMLADA